MCNDSLILLGENNDVYSGNIYIVIKMKKNEKPIFIGLYNNIFNAKKNIKNDNYLLQGPFNVKCKTKSIPMINEKGIITDYHKIITNIYTN